MKHLTVLVLCVAAVMATAASYKAYYTTDNFGTLYDGVGRDWKGNIYIGAGRKSDYDAAVFRYNPSTDRLEKLVQVKPVSQAVNNWFSNDYAGKIHSSIKQGIDGKLYFASHRAEGTVPYEPGFRGGHLYSYDPATGVTVDISAPGVGATGQGIMDVAMGLQYGLVYAVDEESFVYKLDIHSKNLSLIYPYTTGSSTRNMFCDNYGRGIAPTSFGRLMFWDPRNDSLYLSRVYSMEFQNTCKRIPTVVKSASGDSIYFCGKTSSGGNTHIWRYIVSSDVMQDLGYPQTSSPTRETFAMALRWDLNMLYYFVGGTLYSMNVITRARASVLSGVPVGGQAISGSNGVDKDGNLWFTDKTNTSGRVYKITLNIPCAVCTTKLAYLDSAYLNVEREMFEARLEGGGMLKASPNPFNAAAVISIHDGHVGATRRVAPTLAIFDTRGRMVHLSDQLHNNRYTWNASGLPAGVYLAQLRLGNKLHRKKLFLLK
jgi:hypothetical protein